MPLSGRRQRKNFALKSFERLVACPPTPVFRSIQKKLSLS
jgi:hypothetical protein